MKVKEFFVNMAKGAGIGLAMIIPGVSGGTLAVMFGVYDKIIDSVGNIFKQFKKSFLFLLPIILGAILAFAALYYPLKYALEYAPFPTIMLFAGFMLGSCYDLFGTAKKNGFNQKTDIAAAIIPLAVVIGICFIPNMSEVNLGTDMATGGYFLLILIGAVSSCALVVPGISGSMLLLIFGYYAPMLATISTLRTDFTHALLVLVCFAAGLLVGFFTIAKLMQFLLKRFRRTTFWAIMGFVIGSVPAVIITFFHSEEMAATLNGLQIGFGVAALIIGAACTFILTFLLNRKTAQSAMEQSAAEDGTQAEIDTEM